MDLRLVQTCGACPEQYDVLDENDEIVGYLRMRHGDFTVYNEDVWGPLIYWASPNGDGCFDSNEREYFLDRALAELENVRR